MSTVTEIDFTKGGPTPRPSVTTSHVAAACEEVGIEVDAIDLRYNGRYGCWMAGGRKDRPGDECRSHPRHQ